MITFQVQAQDGTMVDWVQIEVAPNQYQSMTKEYYDAQLAAQNTLPSESSIPTTPQAGE